MARHVVSLTVDCRSCGHAAAITHVARLRGHFIRWSSSFKCRHCSAATEADGDDLGPAVRDAFYQAEGRWSVRVQDPTTASGAAVRALRKLSGASLADLLTAIRRGHALVEGTLIECEQVQAILQAVGVDVILTRTA